MSRRDRFAPITTTFLGYFEQEAAEINSECGSIAKCRAYATFPPEDSPGNGSFGLVVACLLHQSDLDHSDLLSLEVAAYEREEKLTVNADLAWNYTPPIEFQVFSEPAELDDRSLTQIRENLPYMFQRLRELLKLNPRGVPIEEGHDR